MKVLISDFPDSMMPDHSLESATLRKGLGPDLQIEVLPYAKDERERFLSSLSDADALLTAFVPIDEEALKRASRLKVIAINATGYDNVDLAAATARNVGVCPVGEYCTWDVSEAAIAYMFALNKGLKSYQRQIEGEHRWDYAGVSAQPRMQDQTLGIVGFGKIGRCTAEKCRDLVGRVIACDPYVAEGEFSARGVEKVDAERIFAEADIIVNHMNLNETNHGFFNEAAFARMERHPLLINLGRGLCVNENDLVKALDSGQIRAFGADVLYDETPKLDGHPLVGRDNVIITPHSAFYSTSSMRDLQVLSCRNIVNYMQGHRDKLFKLVNEAVVVRPSAQG
ncbi:C-terminal binding protein [Eggerthellaceae bacterium zg-1084]|uniref:C-terminal binding protein n=1 Tax=Berryella wangjianweii TaxID=2734634 RepID=A0A6M8J5I5_9ACTN|nr:NAD(P)-dependent oxidoreductase [Berryella wangjianweii]NPD31493.1 C-terminal binding protein [Berryella wangjianweii]QKF07883.1 C-terminal binding protein [Berryella wangjianweii]